MGIEPPRHWQTFCTAAVEPEIFGSKFRSITRWSLFGASSVNEEVASIKTLEMQRQMAIQPRDIWGDVHGRTLYNTVWNGEGLKHDSGEIDHSFGPKKIRTSETTWIHLKMMVVAPKILMFPSIFPSYFPILSNGGFMGICPSFPTAPVAERSLFQVTNAISGMTAIGGLLLLDRSLLGAPFLGMGQN